MQLAPEMLCELVEPPFIPFGEHLLSHKQRARPRPRPRPRNAEHYSQLETPATETSSPRPHTQLRIARTNETKRFPGWTHPPTSEDSTHEGRGVGNRIISCLWGEERVWKPSKDTLTSECLGQCQHNEDIKSDTLFLAALGLFPPTLHPCQTGLDVTFKNATKP